METSFFERCKTGELVRLPISACARIRDNTAPVNRSRTGYGSKVPTAWRVRTIDNRWRRVYCRIFSNVGTLYVMHGKARTIVDISGVY